MNFLTQRLGEWTLPAPSIIHWNEGTPERESLSFCQKVSYYAQNILRSLGALLALPIAFLYSAARSFCSGESEPPPRPEPMGECPEISPDNFFEAAPDFVGGACSMFQDAGAGTRHRATAGLRGQNQWDPFLTQENIDGAESDDFSEFFIDILGHPKTFSQNISDVLHSTAHRLSLEWADLQPEENGDYSEEAIDRYRNLFEELKARGMEPFVTIHHFTHPLWFERRGAFIHKENCDRFFQFATDMMHIFPEVRYWYTFNEIGAFTLEGLLRDHPSPIRNFHDAGKTLRNMLLTHCRIYQAAKQGPNAPQIGLTHQFLKFYPINGNLLEKTVCHLAAKVADVAIYNFFQTGVFTFQVPGQSNIQFSIPQEEFFEKNHRFLDFIGFQFYGPAFIILGSNGGHRYPGHKIVNFTCGPFGASFGGTSPEGYEVTSFGPTIYPDSLFENLNRAKDLGVPIHISEIGVDAKTQNHGEETFQIDRDKQLETFQRYVPIIAHFQKHITAFFAWTPDEGIEWNRGNQTGLNFTYREQNDEDDLPRFIPYPLGQWLGAQFDQVRQRVQGEDYEIVL